MKDFIKWLGVNEKVAKVAVWLLIIMVFLIIFNTSMETMGFPYYAITYDNLVRMEITQVIEDAITILVSILGFYTTVLLVFKVKESKKILKYGVLYYIGNYIINILFGYGALQIYIFGFSVLFCYFYSGKKWKYIIYGIGSLVFISLVQGIWYMIKARFIDYDALSNITRSVLTLDYFIIIAIIILVKEIYLKKRGEKNE